MEGLVRMRRGSQERMGEGVAARIGRRRGGGLEGGGRGARGKNLRVFPLAAPSWAS